MQHIGMRAWQKAFISKNKKIVNVLRAFYLHVPAMQMHISDVCVKARR